MTDSIDPAPNASAPARSRPRSAEAARVPVARQAPIAAPVADQPAAAPAIMTKDETMDTIDQTTTTDAADKAQAMFADANDRAQTALDKGQKLFDEMNAFGKGNIEAIVESSKIAVRGVETLGQDAAAYAKTSFEHAAAAVRSLATVKSPTEFMKLQNDYVRTSFDAMVAEGSRSTERMLKLVGEVVQPISNRIAIAAEKAKLAA